MTEEGMISLNEFKTALEDVRSDIKRVVEVVNHRFDRMEERMDRMDGRMEKMDGRMDRVQGDLGIVKVKVASLDQRYQTMMEQIGLLQESQKAIHQDLDKRLTHLENKVA